MALALGRLAANPDPPPEVRVCDDGQFHDRYLVHENGSVDLIGSPLNGIDKHLTIIMPIRHPARGVISDFVGKLWDKATTIEPVHSLTSGPTPAV
jgi:hypothetical protein